MRTVVRLRSAIDSPSFWVWRAHCGHSSRVGVAACAFGLRQSDPGCIGCGEGLFDAFGLTLQKCVVLALHDQRGSHDLIGNTVEGVPGGSAQELGVVLDAE